MNKTTLTTLILDAAIILAVALFMFVIRPWDKADKKDKADYAPAPELTIAEQEGIEPVEPIVGNSKPVDVEPVDGIRITAPANALDKDREFKITPVDGKTWDEADKKIAEVSGEKMLFCFDLDAGMKPEEHLPGEYTFSMDLEKMGVPSILHDRIRLWRMAGEELYEYTSWVENGKLVFRSDQNSVLITTLVTLGVGSLLFYSGETWYKHKTTGDLYKSFFSMQDDAIVHEIKDKNGDFTLYFRFKDTEDANRFEEYKSSIKNYEKRCKELEDLSETEYERQVNAKYEEAREEWTMWQKIMGSAEARRKAKAAVDKAAILAKMLKEDPDLKKYMAGMALPKSIQDLEEMLKQANAYLTEDQGLRPQTCNLEVNLIDSGPSGEYRRTATKLPYMVINYPKMLGGGSPYTRKGHGESMLLTITHELFHHRQKTHNWPAQMDFRSEESTAAYLESCSADYYLAKGYMTTNFNHPAKGTETKFVKDTFDPASRDNYEVFGNDFNSRIGDPDLAYTYADLMDYIQEHKKMKPLKGGFIMNQYAYTSSYKTNYMKWFGITDEKELEKWIRLFCVDSLGRIYDQQGTSLVKSKHPSLALDSYQFSRSNPIREVRTKGYGLSMRTFDVECSNFKQEGSFNAFIVPGEQCKPDEVWFYTSSDGFKKDKSESTYFQSDNPTWRYSGAYFQGPSSLLFGPSFKIVALFAPDAPVIKKVKENKVKFVLPKADKTLLKNKYISGALVTYKNAEGKERHILATPNKFGKEVQWNLEGVEKSDFSLSVRWIRNNEDGSVYESPDSKPALQGAMPVENKKVTSSANTKKDKKKKEKKQEEQQTSQDMGKQEGRLDEVIQVKENPFEFISWEARVMPDLPSGGRRDNYILFAYNYNGCTEFHAHISPENGDGKIVFTTENKEYRAACTLREDWTEEFDVMFGEKITKPGSIQYTVDILFNEDLAPVSGTYSLMADYFDWPDGAQEPRSCRIESSGSFHFEKKWVGERLPTGSRITFGATFDTFSYSCSSPNYNYGIGTMDENCGTSITFEIKDGVWKD